MKELVLHRKPTRPASPGAFVWERRAAYMEGCYWVRWDLYRHNEWGAVMCRLDTPRDEVAGRLRAMRVQQRGSVAAPVSALLTAPGA